MKKTFIIATRESPLALWQANWVKTRLESHFQDLSIKLLGLTTSADQLLATPLYKVGGKGLFVKELEEALFDGRADLAVHSMKDVPMQLPDGLSVPVMTEREDPRDAFVANQYANLTELPRNAILGTSSLRRQSQLLAIRPDLRIQFLRGNVNTRLKKLDDEEYAAIILAAAGLKRLNFADRIRSYLPTDQVLPAPGQGVLGIECRTNDEETQHYIQVLQHPPSYVAVLAERAMCRYLGGGCHVPIGAYAEIKGDELVLRGRVGKPDGTLLLSTQQVGALHEAEAIGIKAALDLLQQGAGAIIQIPLDPPFPKGETF